MSKIVSELVQELAEQPQIEDQFRVHVLKVIISESGEIDESAKAQPVTHIVLDEEEQECYLYFTDDALVEDSAILSVASLKSQLSADIQDYSLFAGEQKETTQATLELTTPLIGFGENEAENNFFVICQA